MKILDFNGDKRKDILVINGSNSIIYQYSPAAEDFEVIYSSSSFPTITDRIYPGDFNGDKKTDILYWNNGWGLKFSNGINFETSNNVPSLINTDPGASLTDNNILIADLNGDRKDDILEAYLYGGSSNINCFYSQGNGIFPSETIGYPKSNINQGYLNMGDFNGDGKQDLFYNDYSVPSNWVSVCFFRKDENKHLVSCISNGLNFKTWIYYARINKNSDIYNPVPGAQFPVVDYNGAFFVVDYTQVRPANELGFLTTYYKYYGMRIHNQGKGFLGFQKIRYGSNGLDSIYTNQEYSYHPTYFFNYPLKTTVWNKYEYFKISEVVNTYSVKNLTNNRFFPYLSSKIATDYFTNQQNISSTFNYDDYGNVTSSLTEYKTGSAVEETKTVSNTYDDYGNYGIPNKLVASNVTSVYGSEAPYTKSVNYSYDSFGRLLSETSDQGMAKAVVKSYSSFNQFGLPTEVTISAASLNPRTTKMEYDSRGRFVTKLTNPINNFVTSVYDNGTGNIISQTGIDNNTTSFQYDGFGQMVKTVTPQGREIITDLKWDESLAGGEDSRYYTYTRSSTPGKPDEYVYYDAYGRKLLMKRDGFEGYIYQNWFYSLSGSLSSVTWPYKQGESIRYNHYYYDLIGRKVSEDINGLITTIQYIGDVTSVYNPANQFKSTKTNSTGKVVQVVENNNNAINYTYFSNDQPKSITAAGTAVSFTYDGYGRQTSVTNPNSGTTSFDYNAFGEVTSQLDSNGYTYSFQYDNLGRLISKTGTGNEVTSYEYYSGGSGIEKLKKITGPNGVSKAYSYDNYGMIIQIEENIPFDSKTLITSFGYDEWGNNTSITYPSGVTISNLYDDNGYLKEIKNGTSSVWKLDGINSLGQPVQFSLGSANLHSNYEYDHYGQLSKIKTGLNEQLFNFNQNTGNLTRREYNDGGTSLSESFTYDNMNQLKTYTFTGAYNVNYAQNGNINSKSDAGTYSYDNTKINAVTGITGNPDTITTSANQSITYTPFNMASTVAEYEGENERKKVEFTYGPDNQRIKSVLRLNGAEVKKKYYSAEYEKEITATTDRDIHYIYCPYGLVAVIVKQNSTETTYFTETDHLGSILGLMDSNGIYIERSSLDAWGRRRNPTDWTYNNIPVSTITDRGYTGHEHLDMFGLINMNGRMYDPVLGRFLGVDPIVQSPDNSLSYNGYAYCLNNPLKYSDPTGYSYYYDPWTDPTHNTIEQEFADLFGGQYFDLLTFGSNYTGVGKPGEGGNGNGLNGIYYDYETEKWRNTDNYAEVDPKLVSGILLLIAKSTTYSQSKDLSFQVKYPIPNYGGIEGLTLEVYSDQNGTLGTEISLRYTAWGNNGGNWKQWVTETSSLGGPKKPPYWDGWAIPYYYDKERLLKNTFGNSITFWDRPDIIPGKWEAETSFCKPNGEIVFTLYWGFYYNPRTLKVTSFEPRIIYKQY